MQIPQFFSVEQAIHGSVGHAKNDGRVSIPALREVLSGETQHIQPVIKEMCRFLRGYCEITTLSHNGASFTLRAWATTLFRRGTLLSVMQARRTMGDHLW